MWSTRAPDTTVSMQSRMPAPAQQDRDEHQLLTVDDLAGSGFQRCLDLSFVQRNVAQHPIGHQRPQLTAKTAKVFDGSLFTAPSALGAKPPPSTVVAGPAGPCGRLKHPCRPSPSSHLSLSERPRRALASSTSFSSARLLRSPTASSPSSATGNFWEHVSASLSRALVGALGLRSVPDPLPRWMLHSMARYEVVSDLGT
jgi:hypothetical protein